jgi:hypothetical protein
MDFISTISNQNALSNMFNPNQEKFNHVKMEKQNESIKKFENKITRALAPPNLSDPINQNSYQLPPIINKSNIKAPVKHTNNEKDQQLMENGKQIG